MDNMNDMHRWIAEHVMGWVYVDQHRKRNIIGDFYIDPETNMWVPVIHFSPTYILEDAWRVVMKLVDDGFDYELFSREGMHVCAFSKEHDFYNGGGHSTPEMAICAAARKVKEST